MHVVFVCKYNNVQSFFGVKPYCDLGAIGAKRGLGVKGGGGRGEGKGITGGEI